MAAPSLSAIWRHLECSICHELMNTPKILESCNHVFCKNCLIAYAWSRTSLASFPCPECREECKLPANGVDGLRDDFRSASLISTLKQVPQETIRTCNICNGSEAVSVCDSCDLDLCKKCLMMHVKETQAASTDDHVVYDLCSEHMKRQNQYCKTCDKIICMQCCREAHTNDKHQTGHYKEFAGKRMTALEELLETVSKTAKSTSDRITDIDEKLVTHVQKKVEVEKKRVIEKSNAVIKPVIDEMLKVQQEIERLESRLSELEMTKAKHVDEMTAEIKEIDDRIDGTLGIEHHKEAVSDGMKKIASINEQLSNLKGNSWLGLEFHQQMNECYVELSGVECVLGGSVQAVEDLQESISQFDSGTEKDTGPSNTPGKPEVQAASVKAERCERWRSPKRDEWVFEDGNPGCIYSVVSLPKGLAILGGTSDIHPSKIFYFPSMDSKDHTEISDGVAPSRDLAADDSGDLILIRAKKPHLRVFGRGDGYKRYSDMVSPDVLTRPTAITCAEDKIIVQNGFSPDTFILVLNKKGVLLHSFDAHFYGRLAYNPVDSVIYHSLADSIIHKLTDGILSSTGTVLKSPGFTIRDICCGIDGKIYVAGCRQFGKKFSSLQVCSGYGLMNWVDVQVSDNEGRPLVDERVERIRIDIKNGVLIIACGARVMFYDVSEESTLEEVD